MKRMVAKEHLATSRGFVRRGGDVSWMDAKELGRFLGLGLVADAGKLEAVPVPDLDEAPADAEAVEYDEAALEGGVLGLDAEDSVVEARPRGRKRKGD